MAFRQTAIGTFFRTLGWRRWVRYPDEIEDFQLPPAYLSPDRQPPLQTNSAPPSDEKINLDSTSDTAFDSTKRDADILIVTWYSDNDPENPQNWSNGRKIYTSILLFVYTVAAYSGASMYSSSEPGIMKTFNVSETVASLGLVLYVLGYGIAPMILSPLTEIPRIGRNPPYAISYILFTILSLPLALVNNMAGLLVVRFILGVLGSPALTTVGASYGDFISPMRLQYVIAVWSVGACLGPVVGPALSGYAVQNMGWRWSGWELFWLSVPLCILILLTLPETSGDTILLRRAQRLRTLTGRSDLKSESEIRQAHMSVREVAFDALIKPWQINALDPAVLFTTVYLALGYSIYYSFFESFPLVYQRIYSFGLGATALAFLSIAGGLMVTSPILIWYMRHSEKRLAKMDTVPPEERLPPGIAGSVLIPVGLFIFAWTSRPSVHWIASMFGVGISYSGIFLIGQGILGYLPSTYPRYAGSLFAANGLSRSLFASAAVLVSPPMFKRLGVPGGVSLLAGLSAVCVGGMICLYLFGANLRRRSKFAQS